MHETVPPPSIDGNITFEFLQCTNKILLSFPLEHLETVAARISASWL
jgi:hypothetical protein